MREAALEDSPTKTLGSQTGSEPDESERLNVQMQHQQLLRDEEQKLKASAAQQQQQHQQEVCRRLSPSS